MKYYGPNGDYLQKSKKQEAPKKKIDDHNI